MTKKLSMVLVLAAVLLFSLSVFAAETKWDLGGQTIYIQTRWEDVTPLGPRGAYNWYQPDERLKAHIESVEKLFNCKIEFVYRGNEATAFQAIQNGVLAGETNVHFAFFMGGFGAPAAGGYLLPLNDILDEEFWQSYPKVFQFDIGIGDSVGETLYGFEALCFSRPARMMFWNKTMFEREGIESLYDIYDRGEWTWDTFYEIARRLTKDIDGDGVYDQYGFSSFDFMNEVYDFVASNGATFTQKTADGQLVFDLLRPEVLETFEFMQKLWQEGIWSSGANYGNTGMFLDIATRIAEPSRRATMFDPYPYEWGMIITPQGPNGKGQVSLDTRSVGVIPANVQNPREVIEVVSALFQFRAPYIEDLEEWEENYWGQYYDWVWDFESLEQMQYATYNSVLVPDHIELRAMVAIAKPSASDIFTQIVKEGANAASTFAEWEPVIQGILNDLVKTGDKIRNQRLGVQ